jgi:hypothetical protein
MEDFDGFSCLLFHHGIEFLKILENVTFSSKEVNPCVSYAIINKQKKVKCTS